MLDIMLDMDVREYMRPAPALQLYAVELSMRTGEGWSEYNLLVLGYGEDACFVIPERSLRSKLRS